MPTSDPRVLEQASRAMMEHLIPRAAGIMLDMPDGTFGGLASGTCIQVGGRHFIATAAHVLDDVELGQVGVVQLGGPAGRLNNQTPRLVGSGRRGGGDHDEVDIAWLEIMPRAVPIMTSAYGRIFITLDRVSPDPVPPEAAMYVFGVPGELMRRAEVNGRPYVGLVALPYMTRALPMQGGGSAEYDLYAEYPNEMMTEGGALPLPKAPGLSGSGLWQVNPTPEGVWSPDRAKMVAVQHAWSQRDGYLRGTLMCHWLQMLREDIPELAAEIDPVLNRTTT